MVTNRVPASISRDASKQLWSNGVSPNSFWKFGDSLLTSNASRDFGEVIIECLLAELVETLD